MKTAWKRLKSYEWKGFGKIHFNLFSTQEKRISFENNLIFSKWNQISRDVGAPRKQFNVYWMSQEWAKRGKAFYLRVDLLNDNKLLTLSRVLFCIQSQAFVQHLRSSSKLCGDNSVVVKLIMLKSLALKGENPWFYENKNLRPWHLLRLCSFFKLFKTINKSPIITNMKVWHTFVIFVWCLWAGNESSNCLQKNNFHVVFRASRDLKTRKRATFWLRKAICLCNLTKVRVNRSV